MWVVDYVFREDHKKKFSGVLASFANAGASRARPIGDMLLDPDNTEHWAICLTSSDSERDAVQLQAVSCVVCGNYKHCDTFQPPTGWWVTSDVDYETAFLEAIPVRMRCYCK